MTTDRWTERLSELVDDSLSPAERRELAVHLEGCDSCRRDVEAIRRVVARLRADVPSSAPANEWEAIAPRLAPHAGPVASRLTRVPPPGRSIAVRAIAAGLA